MHASIGGNTQSAGMQNTIRNLRSAADWLTDKGIPSRCVFCAGTHEVTSICKKCYDHLPWNRTFCEQCGQPLPAQQPAGVLCAHCQLTSPPFTKARAPLRYAFPVDNSLKALKFRRQLWYVPAFAGLILPLLEKEFLHCDALLPVPLHRWRQARRGFNQAFEICRPLRKECGLRIVTDIQRVRATQSQTGLTAAERRKNLRDAFALPGLLTCRHPLIVDDVITTGATVTQLARTLLRAGAESVSVVAVAQVQRL